MLNHTTQRVSPKHHDQDDALLEEGRRWCIKETWSTTTPFKETHKQPLQSRYKPKAKGAAADIGSTPEQPWRKREGNLDGDLYHCICDSDLNGDVQNNTENQGTHHAQAGSDKTLSNQPQRPHHL